MSQIVISYFGDSAEVKLRSRESSTKSCSRLTSRKPPVLSEFTLHSNTIRGV